MSRRSNLPPYYQAWDILYDARNAMYGRGIPNIEATLALIDFTLVDALASGDEEGNSEELANVVIDRAIDLLDAWKEGRPPFTHFNANSQTQH
ncbi:hypothetical protein NBRC116494_06750 [Aurantivibrio plasticivorans]